MFRNRFLLFYLFVTIFRNVSFLFLLSLLLTYCRFMHATFILLLVSSLLFYLFNNYGVCIFFLDILDDGFEINTFKLFILKFLFIFYSEVLLNFFYVASWRICCWFYTLDIYCDMMLVGANIISSENVLLPSFDLTYVWTSLQDNKISLISNSCSSIIFWNWFIFNWY